MNILLQYSPLLKREGITFNLPPSKSIWAREMLLSAVSKETYLSQKSDTSGLPEDLQVLQEALARASQDATEISVGASGTAMRFMTAYLSAHTQVPTLLYGTNRQSDRPIAPLVEALTSLGADISYSEKDGYPPLLIKPSTLQARRVKLNAQTSSQFLSALLLIAPSLRGSSYIIDTTPYPIASYPYAQMTLNMMSSHGFVWVQQGGIFAFKGRTNIEPLRALPQIETDWTAASYAYLLYSLQGSSDSVASILLPKLRMPSLQGDHQVLTKVFARLGVRSDVTSEGIILAKCEPDSGLIEINCNETPDLVPTIVVACLAQKRDFIVTGVEHLRHKESDRLMALQRELGKMGYIIQVDQDRLISYVGMRQSSTLTEVTQLDPHDDHRMAMAIAPLMARELGVVAVLNAECVGKSFPSYWSEIRKLGYQIIKA